METCAHRPRLVVLPRDVVERRQLSHRTAATRSPSARRNDGPEPIFTRLDPTDVSVGDHRFSCGRGRSPGTGANTDGTGIAPLVVLFSPVSIGARVTTLLCVERGDEPVAAPVTQPSRQARRLGASLVQLGTAHLDPRVRHGAAVWGDATLSGVSGPAAGKRQSESEGNRPCTCNESFHETLLRTKWFLVQMMPEQSGCVCTPFGRSTAL
ncbi:hypothetical protein KTR9_5351 (plasmid) [Gordonia sp. KTR9]|nr:hypothetical protein KTR9_5351 [Gordonia sp. KTR9]